MKFDGKVFFENFPFWALARHLRWMQGMDGKYDSHVWTKIKMTNIKNNFGLGFKTT